MGGMVGTAQVPELDGTEVDQRSYKQRLEAARFQLLGWLLLQTFAIIFVGFGGTIALTDIIHGANPGSYLGIAMWMVVISGGVSLRVIFVYNSYRRVQDELLLKAAGELRD